MKAILLGLAVAALTVQTARAEDEEAKSCPFDGISKVSEVLNDGVGKLRIFKRRREQEQLDPARPPAPFQAIAPTERIYAPEAVSTLEGIRDRLLASSPYGQPETVPEIYVTSSSLYEGYAYFDNNILVSHEILRMSDTDDEVAFILAHELAHILRGHTRNIASLTESIERLELMRKGVSFAGDIATYAVEDASYVDSEDEEEIAEHNRKINKFTEDFIEISEKVAKPSWVRDQEDEADLVAVDLMLRAGYSPAGANGAMVHMQASRNETCQELQVLSEGLDAYFAAFQQEDWSARLMGQSGMEWEELLDPINRDIRKRLRRALMSYALPQTHRDWDERLDRIREFIASEDALSALAGDAIPSAGSLQAYRATPGYDQVSSSLEAAREVRAALAAGDVDTALAGISRVNMASSHGRILKMTVREQQNEHADAVENVALAYRQGPPGAMAPSLRVYQLQAQYLLAAGEETEALKVIQAGITRFRDPVHFLPERISAAARSGQGESVSLLGQCESVARRDLWDVCRAASYSLRTDFRESTDEILGLMECGGANCSGQRFKRIFDTVKEVAQ